MVKSILKTWRGAPTTNQTKENNINTTTTTNKKNPKPTKPVTTETPLTGCPVEPEASLGPCCNHSCTVFQFSDCLFINLDDKCCYLCYQWFKHASLNKMFHILQVGSVILSLTHFHRSCLNNLHNFLNVLFLFFFFSFILICCVDSDEHVRVCLVNQDLLSVQVLLNFLENTLVCFLIVAD